MPRDGKRSASTGESDDVDFEGQEGTNDGHVESGDELQGKLRNCGTEGASGGKATKKKMAKRAPPRKGLPKSRAQFAGSDAQALRELLIMVKDLQDNQTRIANSIESIVRSVDAHLIRGERTLESLVASDSKMATKISSFENSLKKLASSMGQPDIVGKQANTRSAPTAEDECSADPPVAKGKRKHPDKDHLKVGGGENDEPSHGDESSQVGLKKKKVGDGARGGRSRGRGRGKGRGGRAVPRSNDKNITCGESSVDGHDASASPTRNRSAEDLASSKSPLPRARGRSREPASTPKSKSRSPRGRSREPPLKPRSKSRSPRGRSREPPLRPRSKSRSPRGRSRERPLRARSRSCSPRGRSRELPPRPTSSSRSPRGRSREPLPRPRVRSRSPRLHSREASGKLARSRSRSPRKMRDHHDMPPYTFNDPYNSRGIQAEVMRGVRPYPPYGMSNYAMFDERMDRYGRASVPFPIGDADPRYFLAPGSGDARYSLNASNFGTRSREYASQGEAWGRGNRPVHFEPSMDVGDDHSHARSKEYNVEKERKAKRSDDGRKDDEVRKK